MLRLLRRQLRLLLIQRATSGAERRYPATMRSPVTLLLVLGTACTRFPEARPPGPDRAPCADFVPYAELGNHINPFEVAVDAAHRRVYSTSLGNRTLGIYDADTFAILAMVPLRERAQVRPDVVVDASGAAWVLGELDPAVVRYAIDAEGRRQYNRPLAQANDGLPLPDGGLLALGADADGVQLLQRFGKDGGIGGEQRFDGHAHGLIAMRDGHIGLLMQAWDSDGLRVLDPDSLEQVASCTLPFEASRGAQLEDGTVVISRDDAIGLAGCDGAEPQAWQVGVENKDVVAIGAEAVVLDRIGSGEGVDPNLGLARVVTAAGMLDGRSFPTAKNTGYGAYDSHKGLLWVNSEGSAELVAFDPATGAEQARVRTGTFLDGLAIDESVEQGYYATGRLSNSVLRVADGALAAESHAVLWPFSPVVDPARDLVWVLSQTEATVHGLRRSDLALKRSIDPGLGSNVLLTFGSLALHPQRGSLLVAESERDVVLELDPDSGRVLGRWELGGPAIEDPDLIGQLELHVAEDDGALLLVRTTDGRAQRLELDSGALSTIWLDGAELALATRLHSVGISALHAPTSTLYVGGMAVDARSLTRTPEADLPLNRLLGVHPWTPDHLLGVASDGRALVELDAAGGVVGEQPFSLRDLNAPTFRIAAQQEAILVTRSQDASICWFGFERLRD